MVGGEDKAGKYIWPGSIYGREVYVAGKSIWPESIWASSVEEPDLLDRPERNI